MDLHIGLFVLTGLEKETIKILIMSNVPAWHAAETRLESVMMVFRGVVRITPKQ